MGGIIDFQKAYCYECGKATMIVDLDALKDMRGQYHWYCPACAKRQPKICH